ncbi:dethiobiotin synthase [Erwinia psidii]|uniref:ATP-dependent dethiobiotin synthetase BioD n=1 Tax=Erwinia psidii TaxID=69224 RepID=A0A3N6RZZ3_9GAMM|nr:dethiobiotin synthase [Erwinia psidii]MCX8956059.1 ATP-dependent dethiobiotin synthetase BioD [Erwinia psidii]MCX8960174.1 ATP-dependent dethiobiotin synthetase BioD [Erwinia psidii]MCX8963721.1 ATP-dependent dethiobiotin synthetase BioD [Erwinia psidii]RQM38804.1 ATP-dependent dethiobiotin synthetase BioD [Erwinia psidii]
MLKRFFVTGTDTGVGKTVVSRALIQKLSAGNKCVTGFKPVAKSSQHTEKGLRNNDALILQSASSLTFPYSAINPITLPDDEISTNQKTLIDYKILSESLHALSEQTDHVVVEGTGGWRNMMNDTRPLSDWVVAERLPVVMVVGIKLGCISHALLTAEAVINDGLPLLGWVANRINPGLAHYAEIIEVLSNSISSPLLAELPYLPKIETRELADYFDLSELLHN